MCLNCDKGIYAKGMCKSCYMREYLKEYRIRNADRVRSRRAANLRKLREETFAAYGGASCACCGEVTYEFLALDHVEGGGSMARKTETYQQLMYRLRREEWPDKNKYQVLCHNCNLARGFYGECPHRKS